MSFVLEHLDLTAALSLDMALRHPPDDTQRLYVPVAAWEHLLPSERHRIYDRVVELGIEAWCEDQTIVFHRARLPLHAGARRAHLARVAFLLALVPA